MTVKAFTKPPYINPTGPSGAEDLPSKPPFQFRGVTARVFPIKANMAHLSTFCERYLNVAAEDVEFRPSIPYVYLMVINYGSMSAASVQAQNIGWVAQREVAFTVPLERWRKRGNRRVFENWGCVSPFIFVDDDLSLTTGREVYGWPKVISRVEADVPLWATDPRAPTRVFSLSVPLFGRLYAGDREEWRDLLEIDRDSVPRLTEFPPDPRNPWNPLSILPNALSNWLGLAGDAAELLLRRPLRGYHDRRDLSSLLKMSKVGLRNAAALLPDSSFWDPGLLEWLLRDERGVRDGSYPEVEGSSVGDAPRGPALEVVTLKQFRDTHRTDEACYQALILSSIGVERVNRCGLLGDYNLLRGDPSGGYSIRLHRYQAQPIVATLGLEVERTEDGDGAPVAILKPTLPFWTDVDLYYGVGQAFASRAQCHHAGRRQRTPWRMETASGGREAAPADRGESAGSEERMEEGHIPYNTLQGAATQPVTGPFHFPDVSLQVYPLLADRAKLQEFLDGYLNGPLAPAETVPAGMRFEAFGSYVYMVVTVFGVKVGMMWSESNNIGWWADKEVSFCVPVKWYRKSPGSDDAGGAEQWELASLGLVSPFVFGSSGRAVITDREINGRPTVKATIESPADSWLTPSGPVADRRFLRLTTEVFPALNVGQKSEQRRLIEIDGDDVLQRDDEDLSPVQYSEDDPDWRLLMDSWGEELIQDLVRKDALHKSRPEAMRDAEILAAEILGLGAPVNSVHIKQYRDAAELEKACYQAVVKTARCITRLYEFGEIRERVHVRMYRFPGYPIVDTLGLKVKHVDSAGGDVIQVIEPIRPFWMRVGLREHLGEVLCWRTDRQQWTLSHPWVDSAMRADWEGKGAPFFSDGGATRVGRAFVPEKGANIGSLRRDAVAWLAEELRKEMTAICQESRDPLTQKALGSVIQRLRRALDAYVRDRAAARCGTLKGGSSEKPASRDPGAGLLGESPSVDDLYRLVHMLELLVEETPGAGVDRAERIGDHLSAMPVKERYTLVEALRVLLRSEHKPPRDLPTGRLSREAARRSIEDLDDVQVLIETVLHTEWSARRARKMRETKQNLPEVKPSHYLPEGSLPDDWIASVAGKTQGSLDPYVEGLKALGLMELPLGCECEVRSLYCVDDGTGAQSGGLPKDRREDEGARPPGGRGKAKG